MLEVREAETPAPGAGELRIAVAAAGINFADIMARMGIYPDAPPLPCVVGYEVSGTVDALGPGVEGFALGDRVVAATRFNGYTSHLCVPSAHVSKLDDGVTFERAAAVPVNYLTAWYMLVALGNVQPGQRVLIHAVAGGVGQAALQICKWRGAEVFGTASAGKHERLRELGVDHCIDYRSQDFEAEVGRLTAGEGVDIALDAVGGRSFKKSYRCLRELGRLYMFGVSSIATGERRSLLAAARGVLAMPRYGALSLMQDNKGVMGFNLGNLWHRIEESRRFLDEILGLVRDGTFTPQVDATFSFDQAAEAHAYIQARRNFGKVLLTP
ncbi:MAG: zinc-binding dehydrogenase [Myxococcales bacterium]|nr:zinc-binding dehydrogenase [Myxococcales bacterium]